MQLRKLAVAMFVMAAFGALAQGRVEEKEWREIDTPTPPAFEVSRLIAFEVVTMPNLKFGVDPATLTIGPDGILRYVIVARSTTGAMNAMYEGLRCSTGEYKTYARYNASGGWNKVADPQWVPLRNASRSTHTYQFAKQGGCPDDEIPVRVDEVLRELRRPQFKNYN